jgi:flavin-dependent dehydrogenase
VAVRGYVPDIHRPDSLLFEVTGTQPIQYKWQFPLTDRANVGACQMNKCRDLATELRMLVRRYGVTKLAGGVEPLWSGIGTKWHHPGGIVSCGDSAGLINPITGEGITAAFISGEMAAQAISDYLGSKGAVSLVNFSSQMWEVFSAKYKMSTSKDLLSTLRALDSEG